jgi:3-deoxy-7-phosphoheptulonate synthase
MERLSRTTITKIFVFCGKNPELHKLVKGFMIESYIEPGNQKIGGNHIYGKSITDPCLGWEESEKLLYTIAEMC